MHPAPSNPPHAPLGQPGFVSLVGAGPGAPDLLTLRGLRALERATVILHDALLEPGFQALYPNNALVVPVGKRCGGEGTPQEVIFQLLVDFARQGHRVVRLKGGDPLLFGRGGEEAQVLEAHGIPFEFIPGVSSLQGAAAAVGISLTHRGLSREVRILDGHHLLQGDTRWAELAGSGATLAIFMGTRALKGIAQRLLAAGAPPELPVVLVENASGPFETITRSLLAHAAAGPLTSRTDGPGIVYLGPAAGLRIPAHAHPDSLFEAAPVPGPERFPRLAGGGRTHR